MLWKQMYYCLPVFMYCMRMCCFSCIIFAALLGAILTLFLWLVYNLCCLVLENVVVFYLIQYNIICNLCKGMVFSYKAIKLYNKLSFYKCWIVGVKCNGTSVLKQSLFYFCLNLRVMYIIMILLLGFNYVIFESTLIVSCFMSTGSQEAIFHKNEIPWISALELE